MFSFSEKDFLEFAKEISEKVNSFTDCYYRNRLISGKSRVEYKCNSELDTKGEHKIDELVKKLILEEVNTNYPEVSKHVNIFMEEFSPHNYNKNAVCSIFIDPVDGSRSMDQHIGDPCIMFGFSEKAHISDMKFSDLKSCYIKGLHSGDVYFTSLDKAYYVPRGLEPDPNLEFDSRFVPIKLESTLPMRLEDSCVVIRDGYGMRSIVERKIDHRILNIVKHTFSHDITGMELCYLASGRDIVHVLVEARSNKDNGKWRGSDGFNLIPYPLVKAVGGGVYSLNGEAIDDIDFEPHKMYDFIAAVSDRLKNEFIEKAVKK